MKKNESGRSMVEMLGVLAIIGVLSIGGMTGYSLAMHRYQAERIFNAASNLTASTTGGGIGSTHSGPSVNGATLNLNEKGFVCVTWSNDASEDVKDIFNKRVAKYEKSTNDGNCINFRKEKAKPKFE